MIKPHINRVTFNDREYQPAIYQRHTGEYMECYTMVNRGYKDVVWLRSDFISENLDTNFKVIRGLYD